MSCLTDLSIIVRFMLYAEPPILEKSYNMQQAVKSPPIPTCLLENHFHIWRCLENRCFNTGSILLQAPFDFLVVDVYTVSILKTGSLQRTAGRMSHAFIKWIEWYLIMILATKYKSIRLQLYKRVGPFRLITNLLPLFTVNTDNE